MVVKNIDSAGQQFLRQPIPDPPAVLRAGRPRLDHQAGGSAVRRDGVDLRAVADRTRLYPHDIEPRADPVQHLRARRRGAADYVDHLRC